jgi:hypothetical protein
MFDTFFGLPAHPLIVHATVVIVPTAAVAVALAAVWPRFRRWAGWGPLALAVVAVVLTPISTSSGETFERKLGGSPLIDEHSHRADLLIWWVIPLALLAAAVYWLFSFRGGQTTHHSNKVLTGVLLVLPVIVALGTLVQVVLIGHSGAKAVYGGSAAPPVSSLTTTR